MDEIKPLALTHYPNDNPVIRQAFLFCLYAGLQFCDIKDLTFTQVDFYNRLLRFNQVQSGEDCRAQFGKLCQYTVERYSPQSHG